MLIRVRSIGGSRKVSFIGSSMIDYEQSNDINQFGMRIVAREKMKEVASFIFKTFTFNP